MIIVGPRLSRGEHQGVHDKLKGKMWYRQYHETFQLNKWLEIQASVWGSTSRLDNFWIRSLWGSYTSLDQKDSFKLYLSTFSSSQCQLCIFDRIVLVVDRPGRNPLCWLDSERSTQFFKNLIVATLKNLIDNRKQLQ